MAGLQEQPLKKEQFWLEKKLLKYTYVKFSLFINIMDAYFRGKNKCVGGGQMRRKTILYIKLLLLKTIKISQQLELEWAIMNMHLLCKSHKPTTQKYKQFFDLLADRSLLGSEMMH